MPCGGAADTTAFVVPGPALDDETSRSGTWRGPFKDLSGGIKQAKRALAGFEFRDRRRVERSLIVTVEPGRIEFVAPGETPAVSAPGSLYPFLLGRQPPFTAGFFHSAISHRRARHHG